MATPFAGLATAYAQGSREADEIRRRKAEEAAAAEQREFSRLALLANLSDQDVVPEGQRETMRITLPGMGKSSAGRDVDTGIVDPKRYVSLGKAGGQSYYRDTARRVAAQKAAEEKAALDRRMQLAQIGRLETPEPRNIDPLSRQGIDAQKEIDANRAQVRPPGTGELPQIVAGPDGPMAVDRRTLTASPVKDAQGNPVGVRPSDDMKKRATAMANFKKSLTNYRNLLQQYGPQTGMRNPEVLGAIKSAHTILAMEAKNAFELGALAGPDLDLIMKTVGDPVGPSALIPGRAQYLLSQLDELDKFVAGKQSLMSRAGSPHGADQYHRPYQP